MKIYHCEQRSDEWRTRHLGVMTASNAAKIITPKTGALSAQWRRHLYALVYERLTGETAERDVSYYRAVQDGIAREPEARREFQLLTGYQVEQVGFITDDSGKIGCSPDALIVGRNEAVEIKCPQGPTQMERLLDGMDETYRPQVQMQLFIGGWEAVHFYSWHPLTPAVHIVTRPDPIFQRQLDTILGEFIATLDRETERARKLGPYFPVDPAWREDAIPE